MKSNQILTVKDLITQKSNFSHCFDEKFLELHRKTEICRIFTSKFYFFKSKKDPTLHRNTFFNDFI